MKSKSDKVYNPFPKFPSPAKHDGRICFAIVYYDNEQDAELVAKEVKRQERCYVGGFFHGMACGRDKSFDHKEGGKKLYAVTY